MHPSSYGDLLAAFDESQWSGDPLPVSSENSGSVIFTSPAVNYAWRFVHAVAHVERECDFTVSGEYRLAQWHLGELARAGYQPGSPEYDLLEASLLSYIAIHSMDGRPQREQERFDSECDELGMEQAIVRQIAREAS
ncbi:MAG: hypothetical protein QM809_17220 [Gordonia sp. (in: high G+C Gram-positive bacteria)]|uniref:hypothetical protein n=1 Tax=Gordonia sp. (in: high G+C Gram-positive bacteria) TaxID=84139 RepID=UPI0039E71F7B